MIPFSYGGDQPKQQTIHDELPKAAHQVTYTNSPNLTRARARLVA
jgi:hypothetical protein